MLVAIRASQASPSSIYVCGLCDTHFADAWALCSSVLVFWLYDYYYYVVCRYDASRATDMKGRAVAAAGAIAAAIRDLQPGATGTEIANATASAAEAAYDNFADRELKQRNNTTDGTNDRAGSVPAALAATSNAGATERASRSETQPVAVSEAVLEQRNYFSPVMAAYVVGLLIAFGANTITSMGQPALLYLCPCTLGAVALTAASRSELQRVWTFTDVPSFGVPEKDKDKKKQD